MFVCITHINLCYIFFSNIGEQLPILLSTITTFKNREQLGLLQKHRKIRNI